MPDSDHEGPGPQSAAAVDRHPVLDEVTEAARLLGDTAAFLSRTRILEAPHVSDWPADLGDPQTAELLSLLSAVATDVGRCVSEIGGAHARRDAGTRDLQGVAGVLASVGAFLRAASGQSRIRVGPVPAAPQALSFPAPAAPAAPRAGRRGAAPGPRTTLLRRRP